MMATRTAVLRHICGGDLPWPVQLGTRLLLANLLLALAAKIAVPLPWTPVPLTLQTFGMLLIAVLFGARISAVAAGLYLVEGAAGLPVFQPFGAAGAARLFGPTAGYLLAFPVAAFLTGRLLEAIAVPVQPASPDTGDAARPAEARRAAAARNVFFAWMMRAAAMVPGEAVILFCGWAWLAALVGPRTAWMQGVLPFLAGECAKIGAAATIALAVSRRG
jgi:biotin transport system substrate-specific component